MAIFKNFKCPNGAAPEDCIHIPQLVNNIASYFIKKEQVHEVELSKKNNNSQHFKNSQSISKKHKQR